jgi:hypothetical protein
MTKHGELEKYLGAKYAQDLTNSGYGAIGEECSEILNGSLKVLEFYNKVGLAMRGRQLAGATR